MCNFEKKRLNLYVFKNIKLLENFMDTAIKFILQLCPKVASFNLTTVLTMSIKINIKLNKWVKLVCVVSLFDLSLY